MATLDLLAEHEVGLVVLALCLRLLISGFEDAYPERITNVHRSFLPAFFGADHYHRAHGRRSKIIGASARHAAKGLDVGPIVYR